MEYLIDIFMMNAETTRELEERNLPSVVQRTPTIQNNTEVATAGRKSTEY
jgi:hypothetical protein